jgi:anti-sigma-K factor RskA
MNDEPAERNNTAFETLRSTARQLDDNDFVRDDPPAGMWARISTEAAPVVAFTPTAQRTSRTSRTVWALSAAAAMAAATLVAISLRNGSQPTVLASVVLSNANLSPRALGSSGDATLSNDNGSLILHVEVSNLRTEPASYFELWMIDKDVKGMVSLGPFHGNGDYRVPDGIDIAKFPIVDISIEPADGTPTHSGESAVRGKL